MIDSMFQPGTDQALDDQVRRPRAPTITPSSFSFMDLAKSPFQGLGGAAANSLAFGSEITGAFGDVLGAYPEALGLTVPDNQRAQAEAARRKILAGGPDFSNEAGDLFRARAKDIMPDPLTTHASSQIVAGLFQFGAQAIGYGLTFGPAGPLLLGGDVGMSEADRLKQQGVDVETRTKAGAVAGALAGTSVVVPMSGATAAIRAAKGVAVGESAIVGQSLAEKAILKAAGYDKIADTFDPLDPVALAVGLVPGALGAKFGHATPKLAELPPGAKPLTDMGLGERQALKYNDVRLDAYAVQAAQREGIPPEVLLAVKNAGEKSNSDQTSSAGARGVMQFMPSTFREFGRGDPADPINSIDAGAAYLKKLHDAYGDWDAAIAHYNGGGAQAAIVRGGGRPTIPETAAYLDRVKAYLGKSVDDHAAAAVNANPDLVPAARVGQVADAIDSSRLTADTDLPGRDAHVTAIETAADQIGRGEPVDVRGVLGDLPGMRESRTIDDHIAALEDQRAALLGDTGNLLAPGAAADLHQQLAALQSQRPDDSSVTIKSAAKELQTSDRLSYKQALAQAQKDAAAQVAEHDASVQRIADQLQSHAVAQQSTDQISAIDRQLADARARSESLPGPRTSPRTLALAVSDAVGQLRAAREPVPPPAPPVKPNAPAAKEDPNREAPAPAGGAGEAAPAAVPAARQPGDIQPAGTEPLARATIDRAAAEVSLLHPDMLVQMDGMDAPVRVADLLERVKAEAAMDASDAKLVEAAVACALRN